MNNKKKITKEALYHRIKSNFSYGYDEETLHIRMRSKKGEIKKVTIKIGDAYVWESGGGNGALGKDWICEQVIMKKEAETEYFDYWFCAHKPKYKRSKYAFILENEDEKLLYTEKKIFDLDEADLKDDSIMENTHNFFCFPYLNKADIATIPSWVKDTVWYQIFPDRFANGDRNLDPKNVQPWGSAPTKTSFMGGDLRGIIEKLDYLTELGVSGIYLCPIFSATSNHRYDTIDYMEIDVTLGTKETFKELVDKAHAKGIKVMLDAVFNHLGYYSKQWQDVIANEEKSIYRHWFCIKKFPVKEGITEECLYNKNLNYETFGTNYMMPKLNTENSEVREYLLQIGRYWVREFGIDGWRLDVSNEVDHSFWREFRNELLKINPELYLLGEIWHDSLPWTLGDQFHSIMNYPLETAINSFFTRGEINAEEFKNKVSEASISYSRQVGESTFNLVGSHDTSRILSRAKGNKAKVKLAMLFLFTQPGSPCIYYGDEIGIDGEEDAFDSNRKCMVWEEEKQDKELFKFMQKLIKMRQNNSDFKVMDVDWLNNNLQENIIVFRKRSTTVFINNSDCMVKVNLTEDISNSEKINLYSNKEISLKDHVELEPWGFLVVK